MLRGCWPWCARVCSGCGLDARGGGFMTERRDFAVGIFIGGMIGLAFGLLFAPQAGSDTRDRIRRESERLRDRARMTAEGVAEQARRAAGDLADRMRTGADDLVSRARDAFEERADRLRRAFDTGRDAAGGTLEESPRLGEPEN